MTAITLQALSDQVASLESEVIETDQQLAEYLGKVRALIAAHPLPIGGEVTSAGVMLRMSADTERTAKGDTRNTLYGLAQGVKRQVVMAVQTAERLRWGIGEIYCDNSVTASRDAQGKRKKDRPEYDRLREDIAAGDRDAVIMQDQDRLFRDRGDYLEFERLCQVSACRYMVGSDGSVTDLHNMDHQVMATMKAAFAEKDSRLKAKKLRESYESKARLGQPKITQRGYGYDIVQAKDPQGRPAVNGKGRPIMTWAINPAEAEVVREMVRRFLAGESYKSITRWLQASGHQTVTGREWRSQTVTILLTCGRIAGLREYNGEVVGPGNWEAIISLEDHERIQARRKMLADKNTNARTRIPSKHELSGLLRCGRIRQEDDKNVRDRAGEVCHGRLFPAVRDKKSTGIRRRYVCSSDPDHDGCGRLTVTAVDLEALLSEALFDTLDSEEFAATLAERAQVSGDDSAALAASLSADDAELKELSRMKANRRITMGEWLEQRDIIDARMRDTRRRLETASAQGGAWALLGKGAQLREQWPTMDASARHAHLRSALVEVIILPGKPGATALDPARVRPVWRDGVNLADAA